jgi:hypothetical protein
MQFSDVVVSQQFLTDDLPPNPADRTKFYTLAEITEVGLIYHGWYIGSSGVSSFDLYYPESEKAYVEANYPDDQKFIHPQVNRDTTWFFRNNSIWCKAPDAPDSLTQPLTLPEGTFFAPWFYYIKSDTKHFSHTLDMSTPDWVEGDPLVTTFSTAPFVDEDGIGGLFYYPKWGGALYKVYAVSRATGGQFCVDLLIIDCTPRDTKVVDGTPVIDEAVVLYEKNFFSAAEDTVVQLTAICPGDGSKSAWEINPAGSAPATLWELRLSFNPSDGVITPELVQLDFSDLPMGSGIDGMDGTVQTSGTDISNKSPVLDRGTETVNACSGGGSVTTANNTADWTDGTNEKPVTSRDWKFGRTTTIYYDTVYVNGNLWLLHNMFEYHTTRTRSYGYTQSGNVNEIFVDGTCSKTYSGTANWEKTTTDIYAVTETHYYRARTFDGDINLCTIQRDYSGTYVYNDKWEAVNSLSIVVKTPNTNKYDHEDSIDLSISGLFGSFNYDDSGSYTGQNAPTLNPDLIGCPRVPGTTGQDLSLNGPTPLSNFDFHHSHLVELEELYLKNKVVGEQGLARTSTELPDSSWRVSHSYNSFILSSGVVSELATDSPTPPWESSFLDGHEGNYDFYPFWADDVQELKHRYLRSFGPFTDPGVPNYEAAVWF